MIGETISHYHLLEKLGEGGMGVVYKAEDTKLKRHVALKFLAREFTGDEESIKRFEREAQATASLNHPNIVTIYEIGEHEGQTYIAMEFVDGLTLGEKMSDAGPGIAPARDEPRATARVAPTIAEILNTFAQICDGLQAAHEADIVHRDIKPGNIMIDQKGRVKILDFGLAKLSAMSRITSEISTVGTVQYMSPEQVSGDEVDHRSDIWSLGVMLYEMVTGQLPFKGERRVAIMHAIQNTDPEPVTGLRTGIPMELERIIFKLLSKDPAERYQGTVDLLVDLKKIMKESKLDYHTSGEGVKPKRKAVIFGAFLVAVILAAYFMIFRGAQGSDPSSEIERVQKKIAILPFADMSPKQDHGWFCDGIAEELINRLTKISEFQVIARTSAFSFKGKKLDIPTIGKRLNVDVVLDGSVRKDEDNLRVTAQLVNVSDGYQIWSETYNRKMKELFAVQDEISQSVFEKLEVSLLKEKREGLKMGQTSNVEAYNLYLRGNHYYDVKYNEEDQLRIAIKMYEKAIKLDTKFALAYTRLSYAYSSLHFQGFDRTGIYYTKAKNAIDKAFKISPDLPEAHLALGWYYYRAHLDYERALEQCKKAQKNLSDHPDLIGLIGFIWRRQGKFEKSVEKLKEASGLDPLNPMRPNEIVQTYRWMRRYKESEYYLNRAISLSPDWCQLYGLAKLLYINWKGSTEKVIKLIEEAPETVRSSLDPGFIRDHISLYIIDRNYQKALSILSMTSTDTFRCNFHHVPKALLYSQVYGLLNNSELEKKYYDSARTILEKRVVEYPNEAHIHSSLGIAYAGLGRKQDAIRHGRRAAELYPVSKDKFSGPNNLIRLARIYTMVGEYNQAIEELEFLLSIPSPISIPEIRVDPTWDPLRTHPRYLKLIKEKK